MEITGAIKKIYETQEVGKGGFRKRELVITTADRYPQHILVEFTQNNTTLLDAFKEGEEVTIQIDIRGREWTSPQGETKYFNSIQGWRIEKAGQRPASVGAAPAVSGNYPPPPPVGDDNAAGDDTDDLPF
ncbi:MAG: DUF3127 domain-containing protein [Flavobacteriales bacterium]|jgi:hypothetical protein|nr:DUF3127 domain-containing protein [Flavobacteriales bacterium]